MLVNYRGIEGISNKGEVVRDEDFERSADRMPFTSPLVFASPNVTGFTRRHAMTARTFVSIRVRALLTTFAPRPLLTLSFDMVDKPKRPKKREGVLSSFNMAIDGLNLAKEFSSITPAKPVFGSVAALLTMIRVTFLLHSTISHSEFTHGQDTMINEKVYVELGFSCADICRAIERGIDERKLDDFSGSVRDAIDQLKA